MSWLAALSGALLRWWSCIWIAECNGRSLAAGDRLLSTPGQGAQGGNQRTPGAPAEWPLGSRSWESGSEAAEVALAGWSRAASSRAAHSSEHRFIRRNRCFVCGVPTQKRCVREVSQGGCQASAALAEATKSNTSQRLGLYMRLFSTSSQTVPRVQKRQEACPHHLKFRVLASRAE